MTQVSERADKRSDAWLTQVSERAEEQRCMAATRARVFEPRRLLWVALRLSSLSHIREGDPEAPPLKTSLCS